MPPSIQRHPARPIILTLSLLAGGCQAFYVIPRSDELLAHRIEQSRTRVAPRRRQAASMGLADKAARFEIRTRAMSLEGTAVPAAYRRKHAPLIGDLETACHLLAALSFRYGTTRDAVTRRWAWDLIASLEHMDACNGLDGYLPKRVRLRDGALAPEPYETHSNAYAQLLFAYVSAWAIFDDDDDMRGAVRDHVRRIAAHFLDHDLALTGPDGAAIPYSDLRPSRSRMSRSRILDALVLAESVRFILPEHDPAHQHMSEHLERMVACGYLRKIQSLRFEMLSFTVPTDSTDWLNFLRLHTLCATSGRSAYVRALDRLYRSQQSERNALFIVIHRAASTGDERSAPRAAEMLATFPLDLDNREIINSRDRDVARRWFPRWVKNGWRAEARAPLPIYRRPSAKHEWKHNPFRIDGNFGAKHEHTYPGIDFLLAYWMGRYHGLIDADD
ncbi:MAG: hypothetical protein CMJ18_06255 [Phycisphaeraceae bacterium]|nr:hypothetical protein [Phycisphaeraceae bacterium]